MTFDQLRLQAEVRRAQKPPVELLESSSKEILHELQLHQIDLEMQNEELWQARAALEVSRDRYVNLYEFSPVSYLTITNEGMIAELNLRTATMLGIERKNLLNSRFEWLVAKQDKDRWNRLLLSMKGNAAGEEQEFDLILTRKDGSEIWAHLSCLRMDGKVAPGMLRIALIDVTERKRMENALRKQAKFFRIIAEHSEDFIVVLDLEGRRRYYNRAYASLHGDVDAHIMGTDFFAEIHLADRDRVKAIFRDTVNSGIGHRIEFQFVQTNGQIRHIESCGGLIRNSAGKASCVVVVSHDISARKQLEDEIYHLAFYDQLTSLPNRRLLSERLCLTMAASKRSGCYGALMFLDLDNFKPLNDLHGHSMGDLLLIEVASRLRACVREVDTVSRFGGDEFVVVVNALDTDRAESITEAWNVAKKICDALSKPYLLINRVDGRADTIVEHYCTVSIGVTLFFDHEASETDILKWADTAMYQAKATGRNSIQFYDSKTCFL
jgi:diguanylate cyclase (GGDEF)-like protein/PAS domain S-box-containing protein